MEKVITLPPLTEGETFAAKPNDHENGALEIVVVRRDGSYVYGMPDISLDACADALNRLDKSITLPPLTVGEIYAGIALNEDGASSHHVILLDGDADEAPHQVQIDWAKSIGGELPTRQEQSLLFANCKKHFQKDWYWSSDLYEPDSGYAWFQYLYYGYQRYTLRSLSLRARAVRRVAI